MKGTLAFVLGFSVALAAGSASMAAGSGRDVLSTTGVTGGLIVHLGCGDGSKTITLLASDSCLVYGLDTDPAAIEQARHEAQSQNLSGRLQFDVFDGKHIPIIDNLATLVIADQTEVPMTEIQRVLHPLGVAYVGGQKTIKPMPGEIDQWTHYLHGADNNAVAHDSLVGPPLRMQFLSAPLWSRHHDRLASISSLVTAGGRIFYIIDNGAVFDANEPGQWTVTARNAFNGVLLWRQPISSWTNTARRFRSGPVQIQRLLAADGDRVFVTLGLDEPVSVLDAVSGEAVTTLDNTKGVEEFVLLDDILYAIIGQNGAEHALMERGGAALQDYKTSKLIKAIDVTSGRTRWRWPAEGTAEIMPRTLAASENGVFFQQGGETVCVDAATGQQRWITQFGGTTPSGEAEAARNSRRGKDDGKKKKRGVTRSPGWTFATLVVQDGVVLSSDNKTLWALEAKSGKLLWQCEAKTPFGKTPSVDILVLNGIVWASPTLTEGHDLRTGEIVATNNMDEELLTAGHHHRCYRNKATDRYIIQSYRGLEFTDTQGDHNVRHNWIRGICQYGIMPANGMVYIPPHNCGCYPEALLHGFWALKSSDSSLDLNALEASHALVKGPAYDTAPGPIEKAATNWPMHRHDAQRSGTQPAGISAGHTAWTASVGGRVSAAVVADGIAVLASMNDHRVLAFDAETGTQIWTFTAGGKVDSSPTVYRGRVLFGSADGCVYCLRLLDGELAWRFRAAPAELKTVALEQVESLWPVHGSVLVAHDTAYFTAGRSSFIDGGLFLYGLDPMTGRVKCSQRLNSPPAVAMKNTEGEPTERFSQNAVDYKTRRAPDHSDAFSMSGNRSDVMVADGEAVYLRHQRFDLQLQPSDDWTHHLFSTSSLLDEAEAHRSHWFYGNGDFSRLPVAYEWLTRGSYGGFTSPLGKLLVFDDQTLWGTGWGKMALYKTDIRDIDQRLQKDFPKGQGEMVHQMLAESLPIHPRAMIKAGGSLYLAGYAVDSGRLHRAGEPILDPGILLEVDADSGEIKSRWELPTCPVFTGLSAAGGRLYLALENGTLMCRQ